MKIAVVGRRNVGGGLAQLWTDAGHDLTALGRAGGEVSDAEVVVIAVPGATIADALSRVGGLAGQTTIDATNSFDGPREGFPSLAAEVKSIIGGPTAKSFNTNFASIYSQIASQRVRPSNVFASDPDAHAVTDGDVTRKAGRPRIGRSP